MATSRKRKRRRTKCADRGKDRMFEELARLKTEAGRTVTRLYLDLGTQLRVAKEQEAEYGSNIVEQLAEYLDFPGGEKALRALRILAETYDWAFVDKETSKPLANGQPLTLNHLIVLARVASAADRRRLLKQARKHSLDVDELAELVRTEREKRERERREAEEAQMQEWLDLWDSEIEREEDPDVDGFVDRVCRDGSFELVDRFRMLALRAVAANG